MPQLRQLRQIASIEAPRSSSFIQYPSSGTPLCESARGACGGDDARAGRSRRSRRRIDTPETRRPAAQQVEALCCAPRNVDHHERGARPGRSASAELVRRTAVGSCSNRLPAQVMPACVAWRSKLARAAKKLLRLDHFAWMRRASVLLVLLILLLAARHLAWHNASAGLLLISSPIEDRDSWNISPSSIAGMGIHASRPLRRGASLGPCVVWTDTGAITVPQITAMGAMVNHAASPSNTAVLAHRPGGDALELELVLVRDLRKGEEVTTDYLISPAFIALPMPWWR